MPLTLAALTPCSAIIFAAEGIAIDVPAGGGALAGAGVGAAACGLIAGPLAPAVAAVSMRAMTSPDTTVPPSPLRISTSTPSAAAGNSSTTLSVSTSIRFSSRVTASPTFLCHDSKVASATDSDNCGTATSMIAIGMNLCLHDFDSRTPLARALKWSRDYLVMTRPRVLPNAAANSAFCCSACLAM